MTSLALLFGVMLLLLAAGFPIFLGMAVSVGVFAFLHAPLMSETVIVQSFMRGLDNAAFTPIAHFFLAGAVMNAGGMSRRLLRLARAMVGHFRGGLSHANVAASVVFAGVSGSAVADAAAVGSVMIPAMKKDGYSGSYAAAVTSTSATLGLVIPPSIPMVVFALFTPADVGMLFLAGVLPGLGMAAALIFASVYICHRRGYPIGPWLGWTELWAAFRESFLALLMPVLVVYGLVAGIATTAEIGAVAAVYAILVSVLVYRETSLRQFWQALQDSAAGTARILIIIAISGAFVWIVARLGIATGLAGWIAGLQLSPLLVLAVIALTLLLLGTVLEPITILIVIAPVITPAALVAGVDITHLGVVVVLAAAIGLVTPPVGVLIYLTASQANVPALDVVRESLPFLLMLVVLLGLVVTFPAFTLWLPSLLGN